MVVSIRSSRVSVVEWLSAPRRVRYGRFHCIILFEPFTFIIATAHKFPAEAEGKSIGYISSTYNHIIILNQILTLQVELTS